MNMNVEKLDLLVMSQLIDEKDRSIIEKWMNDLECGIIGDEEKTDVFMTHCAMILAREKKDQTIEELDMSIFNEIDDSTLEKAKNKLKIMSDIHRVKKFEEGYILVHLCNLLNEQN